MRSIQSFFLLLLSGSLSRVSHAQSGITGTQTGYDTVYGQDAICWESYISNSSNSTASTVVVNSTFAIEGLSDESILNGYEGIHVNLLSNCPSGTYLKISPPKEFSKPEPLTQTEYNYTIQGQINLTGMQGFEIASDSGNPQVKIEIVACQVSSSFCSPFVHEETEMALAGTADKTSRIDGGSHGGTHVDMGGLVIELEPSTSMIYNFDVQVPTIIADDGIYNIIGVVKFFTGSSAPSPEFRYDIANSIARGQGYHGYVTYSDAPIISKVETEAYVFAYLLIGISSTILVVMIGLTIKYYKSQVMQICQAPFLLVYQVTALMAVLCCILLEAKNDVYCNWSLPLIVIPVQLHNAITLGRLYRIHTVVSPLLSDHLTRLDTRMYVMRFQMKILSFCLHGRWQKDEDQRQIRRTVRPRQVVWIIAVWTIPQIVLQIVRLAIQPFDLAIQYQEDFSIGRPSCTEEHLMSQKGSPGSILTLCSFIWLGLQALMVLGMAYVSRGLPSILNESRALFSSITTSFLSSIVISTAIFMSNTPDASPGLRFVLLVCMILILVMLPTIRIVGPKLVLAHSGVKILLHEMLSEHKNQSKPPPMTGYSSHESNIHVTGTSFVHPSSSPSPSAISLPHGTAPISSSSQMAKVLEEGVMSDNSDNGESPEKQEEFNAGIHSQEVWLSRSAESQLTQDDSCEQTLNPHTREMKVDYADGSGEEKFWLIRNGEAPPGALVGNMIDLQAKLNRVTKRIAYGIAISPEDWKSVCVLSEQLESSLSRVKFESDDFSSARC